MHFMEYDTPINNLIRKTLDIFLLSALWFICCIPVFTIGASTTALYYAGVKGLRKNRGYVIQNFFHAFRRNFLPAILLWLFYGFLAVVLYIWFMFALAINDPGLKFFMSTVYMFMGLIFLSMGCYSFPVLSRCSMKCRQIIRFSFGLMIRHFPSTLLMVLIVVAVSMGMWSFPLFVFCLPAVGTLSFSLLMERILLRYTPENEKNNWYAEKDGE